MLTDGPTRRWTPGRLAFAGAFAVRLFFLFLFKDNPLFIPVTGGSDRSLYDQIAVTMAAGNWWPDGVFQYMPLYAWALALLYKVGGVSNFVLAALLGVALDAATCGLIVRLGRRLGFAAWACGLAAALYALYPLAVIYSVLTMPNTLNAFLLTFFAERTTALLQRESPSWKAGVGLGVLAGVGCLSFAGMLLVTLASAAFLLSAGLRQHRPVLPHLLPLVLIPPLLILPITVHNSRAEPGFVLITAHGGFNFWMGNHAGATGYPMQIEGFRGDRGSLLYDAIQEAERKEGRKLTSAEFSQHWSDRARSFIRSEPGAWTRLMGLKAARFFNAVEYDDLRMLPMLQVAGTAFSWPIWPGFGLLAWLGLAGLFLVRGAGAARAITVTAVFSIVSFFVTSRYRLTLAPLLAVFAAGTLSALPELAGARRVRAALVLLAGALLVWWPLAQTDFRPLDHYNAAAHYLDRGLPVEAMEVADRGLALAPNAADLHFARGIALFALNRLDEAQAAFERARTLQPRHAQACFNLAVIAKMKGDPAHARRQAEAALDLDPALQMARDFLAELDKDSGRNR